MGTNYKPDSYTLVTSELANSEKGQRFDTRVIPGEYEVVNPEKYLLDSVMVEKVPLPESGIVFHEQSLTPLTEQLLAQSKGQAAVWTLKPKAPANEIEKKFEKFLKVLASIKGCTTENLKNQGFTCQSKGESDTTVNFPNKDLSEKFGQMLKENISAWDLLTPAPSKEENDRENHAIRPR